MPSLDQLTCEMFMPLIGQEFRSGEVVLHLHGVTPLGHKRPETSREPFSLILKGRSGFRASQGTYRFENKELGELEIFITQVADGEQGSEFEAIFT